MNNAEMLQAMRAAHPVNNAKNEAKTKERMEEMSRLYQMLNARESAIKNANSLEKARATRAKNTSKKVKD